MSETRGSHGRGWNWNTMSNDADFAYGANYQSQWNTTFENESKLKYVIITGWNEWTANKDAGGGEYWMVDTYNDEFSRDIEPSRTGGLKDKFYLQTGVNIRKFKYTEAEHYKYPSVSVDIADFAGAQWNDADTFASFTGKTVERDYPRCDYAVNLEDFSNRNEVASVSVCRDSQYLYFRITASGEITGYNAGDAKWMNIWIRTQNQGTKNGIGFDYVINKKILSDGISEVSKATGANTYSKSGEAAFAVDKNVMQVKVPLAALGLDARNYDIEFKVSDNIKNDADILDFYCGGNSAPIGSLCYKFGY
jgi:hypothetical protein